MLVYSWHVTPYTNIELVGQCYFHVIMFIFQHLEVDGTWKCHKVKLLSYR